MTDGADTDIKLIALDLDGTLLNKTRHVSERNREVLREAASRGVRIVLSSGRMTDCITPFAEELGIDCTIISYNGGMARGRISEERKILYHRPLSAEYGKQLIDYCRDRYMLNYYVDDKLFAQDNAELREWADIYSQRTTATYNFMPDLAPLAGEDATKTIIIVANEERERLYAEWVERWGDETTIVRTDPEYLEILDKGTNKGVALTGLCESLGLKMSEAMAMGDGDNDIQMLSVAGLGIAVANASPPAKEVADVVMDVDHQADAVAVAVEKYVLYV